MEYPRFVARQWPIGSGAVESTCKCLVEARLKQAGMRWGVPGSQARASLRALHRSGRWTTFWQTGRRLASRDGLLRPRGMSRRNRALRSRAAATTRGPSRDSAPCAAAQTHVRPTSAYPAPLPIENFRVAHLE